MGKFIFICVTLLSIATACAFAAGDHYAVVTNVKGDAKASLPGKSGLVPLVKAMELPLGTRLETGVRSFVQLRLVDDSVVNISSNSKMLLEAAHEGETNLLNLLEGSMRAVVKKAVNQNREKMIVRTRSAAMGIRGTDFIVNFNRRDSSTRLTTVHGLVAMVPLNSGVDPAAALQGKVALVGAGQFAVRDVRSDALPEPKPIPSSKLQELKTHP